jgi:hypothetical protein
MKQLTGRKASAFAAGAAALLLWAPIASADDPPDCDQLPPDQVQQCQQQKDAAIANRAVDEAKQGADQAKKAADQAQKQQQQQDPRNKPISQVGATYILNGAPICLHNWDVGIAGAVPVVPFQPC